MDGSRKFVAYTNGLFEDFIKPIDNYYSSGKFVLTLSPETTKAEIELNDTYKVKNEIGLFKKSLTELSNKINDKSISGYSEEELANKKANFFSHLSDMKTRYNNEYKRIFKRIFNEEL